MEGVYQNQEEINDHLTGVDDPNVEPGDIRFNDINGDGVINSEDRTFIGDPHPDFTYGFTFSGQYRNLDFSIFIQGEQGADQYNQSQQILNFDTRPFNFTTKMLDAWDGEGSTNEIPRVSLTDNGGSRVSSLFVEDASYLRLKSLEVGYTLDSLLGQLGSINNLRVYASADNILTVTGYDGLDPELTDLQDLGTFPVSRNIAFGVDISF